jgi:hypothetical protein
LPHFDVCVAQGSCSLSRDANHLVQNYWMAGLVGTCASLATVALAGRLDMHQRPVT